MQPFIDSVKFTFSRFTDFDGRSSRSEYWFFFLFNVIVQAVASAFDAGIRSEYGLVSSVVGLVLLLPGIAVSIRRLHDIGRSGWWLLIILIPIVGVLVLLYFFVQPSKDDGNPYRAA
jgi:uncharacterized membrane protein YhaH (DUF805 family)